MSAPFDRTGQISVSRIAPAQPTAALPHRIASARIEIGRLLLIDCHLLKVEGSYRVKLAQRGGWDFAPPVGRKIVRDAVVAAWEARQ